MVRSVFRLIFNLVRHASYQRCYQGDTWRSDNGKRGNCPLKLQSVIVITNIHCIHVDTIDCLFGKLQCDLYLQNIEKKWSHFHRSPMPNQDYLDGLELLQDLDRLVLGLQEDGGNVQQGMGHLTQCPLISPHSLDPGVWRPWRLKRVNRHFYKSWSIWIKSKKSWVLTG